MVNYIIVGALIAVMVYMSISDVQKRKIPIMSLIACIVLVVIKVAYRVCVLVSDRGVGGGLIKHELITVLLSLIPGGILIMVAFATKKVGVGDGILLCILGMSDNYVAAVLIFCAASFVMAMVSIILLAVKKVNRNTKLPFIPFLTLGYVAKQVLSIIYK